MTRKEIEQEYKKLGFELFENKPKINTPYPPEIVKRREFLLFAQVHLGNILGAKLKGDEWDESFETDMYHKVMEIYYNWEKDKQKGI
ncbi:hypothetical protein KAW65_01520 [candidate division WOR-3 bacterium]|nr:hypothetical protein [candidate division WOR-3 bacterium]